MQGHAMASTCGLLLLSLLSLPVRVYVNVSSCREQVTGLPQHLQDADAIVVLHPLPGDEWSLFSSDKQPPQELQITQPDAAFIAVNFKTLNLLAGDKVVVRDPSGSVSAIATSANASALIEKTVVSNKSPHSLLLRTHPFLVKGDTIVVEYIPSIMTLMLPTVPSQRDKAVMVMDSYAYISYSPGNLSGVDTESTVGATDEAKEAVCYRKSQPKMYAKARAVARLMIRSKEEQAPGGSDQTTSWVFCTGWLIGQGNHLITNHHCMKDAAAVEQVAEPAQHRKKREAANIESLSDVIKRYWPHSFSPPSKPGRVAEAVVGFMAETKLCREKGYLGEKVGVVEATRVEVVTENPDLDYALLRVLTNDSVDLAHRYGYLRLRAAGPVDGENIYIPQHPRGEPKEIAATKDGKAAIIEVLTASSSGSTNSMDSPNTSESYEYHHRESQTNNIQPTVWYNADTEPGSSGSPVLGRKDNTVVALHRAGSSETAQSASTELFNMGVRIDLIARDLQQRKLLPKNALSS